MTSDHVRNALIMLFIFNLALLAQNFRSGARLDAMIEQYERDDAKWQDRWAKMQYFIKAREAAYSMEVKK